MQQPLGEHLRVAVSPPGHCLAAPRHCLAAPSPAAAPSAWLAAPRGAGEGKGDRGRGGVPVRQRGLWGHVVWGVKGGGGGLSPEAGVVGGHRGCGAGQVKGGAPGWLRGGRMVTARGCEERCCSRFCAWRWR